MLVPLYEVGYADGSTRKGGDLIDPSWSKSSDGPIAFISFRLPSGDLLLLKGYEEYNMMIEATMDFNGPRKGEKRLAYIYLMGCRKGEVTSHRIALHEEGQGIGDTTVRKFPKGKEYNGKSTAGWKEGVVV